MVDRAGAEDHCSDEPTPAAKAVDVYCAFPGCSVVLDPSWLRRFHKGKYCGRKHAMADCVARAKARAVLVKLHVCALEGCGNVFRRERGRRMYCRREHFMEARRQAARIFSAGRCMNCRSQSCAKLLSHPRKRFCNKKCRLRWQLDERARVRAPLICKLPGCPVVLRALQRSFCSPEHKRLGQKLQHQARGQARAKFPDSFRAIEAAKMKCGLCRKVIPLERAMRAFGRGWKAFCTDQHRNRWWKQERNRRLRKAKPGVCDVCEGPINRRKRPTATTCGTICKTEKSVAKIAIRRSAKAKLKRGAP